MLSNMSNKTLGRLINLKKQSVEGALKELTHKPLRLITYKTTSQFLKMFGYETLANLPELPRYKLDANRQIVIDEIIEA